MHVLPWFYLNSRRCPKFILVYNIIPSPQVASTSLNPLEILSHQMTDIITEEVYAAVSANRLENSIHCRGKYLLFSRSRCPILYDLKLKQVAAILVGHKGDVNGVSFVENTPRNQLVIISTSYDKTAKIWSFAEQAGVLKPCELLYTIQSPETKNEFMTRYCRMASKGDAFLTITSTVSGHIQLFKNDELIQNTEVKHCCFDINHFSFEGQDNFEFLAIAGSDNKVHIYQLDSTSLIHLLDLEGHSDWVKCLRSINEIGRDNECLLASASQDEFVRVWQMKLMQEESNERYIRTQVSEYLTESNENGSTSGTQSRLTATLETVLTGHEGMVHGLCWFKNLQAPALKLITCSADKTIAVWTSSIATPNFQDGQLQEFSKYEQEPASGEIWQISHQIGETGETNLPFLSVCLSQNEDTIFANSMRGAIHSWTRQIEGEKEVWEASETITGHSDAVTDLSWEKKGAYLLSSSLDKTCRLHAQAASDDRWHEIARPQVHGHEINCLTSLNFTKFATGAEEKTIRAFEATQFFLRNYKTLAKDGASNSFSDDLINQLPAHAQLPALGLSNRGAQSPYDIEESGDKSEVGSASNAWYGVSKLVMKLSQTDHLDKLPFEEILLQSTLWWETSKLFGHSNELHALSSDSTGAFLASASKANRADLANIIVWECPKYRKVASIEHHSLTITRLRFSPDDKYLLSVSRDRTWCLSEKTGQLRSAYKKLLGTSKSNSVHDRIIWDCCWTPDSNFFITVSRDKKAILWSVDDLRKVAQERVEKVVPPIPFVSSKTFNQSIQAVDCSDRIVAFGLEDGSLELYSIELQFAENHQDPWTHLKTIRGVHHLPIRRLAFRPRSNENDLMLASAGDDCIVKLTRIKI